ncbi:diaminopimelate decarboxylase [Paenibacillus methanolicus]|uniref:diaminopimelate decarboxylase n=1 Tax=Paenibacillus methanolicus TaxID=582686 RepID=UPI001FE56B73|nr:diaminopimelate decarboxylase [Paenibacillus methanolicus]
MGAIDLFIYGTQRINQEGHLEIGGCDTVALAKEYGTPLYVIDEEAVRQKCRDYVGSFQAHWDHVDVAYASKAFMIGRMVQLVREEGMSLDVVSEGELRLALWAGAPASRITFHGNYKTADEIKLAVASGVRTLVVDCLEEVQLIELEARSQGKLQAVDVRLNLGINVYSDPKYTTGHLESKFGLTIHDGAAHRAIEAILQSASLMLRGIHFHLGSQIQDVKYHQQALEQLAAFIQDVTGAYGWKPSSITMGGGMGVNYSGHATPPTPRQWADGVMPVFREKVAPLCEEGVVFGIEPGRSVVAEYGTTLYTVGPIKSVPESQDVRAFLSIDGGLSDNPRPIMYEAHHHVLAAACPGSEGNDLKPVRIFGRHCETDMMMERVHLPEVATGDVLAVQCTGAYTYAMSNHYNRFMRPAVVFVREGQSRLAIRRETFEDSIRTEMMGEVMSYESR